MADVGTRLIFENEQVKVWEFTLGPGEAIGAHTHEHDYFFYPIEGGELEVVRGERTDRVTLEGGRVYYRRGGDTHGARNPGRSRYHEILVEIKPRV